ncbi:MAG: hypothetical protein CVU56_24820 [Deltaproteobacteria bacterium HGW-Deltaproteobacteria-14]|jgi:hypothetical protein|nr:MAG: hypothetical protein CVU56_24820 [Deltaproteobacteria bacterium HGW-Deltaproteobacteria-14]
MKLTAHRVAASPAALIVLALLASAACVTTRVAGPEIAPPPFTAEQIRGATDPGRTYVYRVHQGDGTSALRTLTFTRADEVSATLHAATTTPDGEALDEPTDEEVTWDQLVAHAAWPRAATEISAARVAVLAGSFDAKLYTVREVDDDGAEVVTRAWFATALPGAPVRFEQVRSGVTLFTMELVEHRPGAR